jgi:hypothetical protein
MSVREGFDVRHCDSNYLDCAATFFRNCAHELSFD